MLGQKSRLYWAAAAFSLLGACATDGAEDTGTDEEANDPSLAVTCEVDAGKDAGPSRDAGPVVDSGSGHGNEGIPCPVQDVLDKKCLTCHGTTPRAPFTLLELEDWAGPGYSNPAQTMAQAARARINATTAKMPPASAEQLTATELKTLNDWLAAGAKPGETCGHGGPTEPKPDAGVEPGTGGSGGAHNTPIKYTDPNVKCYQFKAYRAPGQKTTPYTVPIGASDTYIGFNIKTPWTGTQYIKSFKSIIDNTKVLHHWLLFKQLNGGNESVAVSSGAHPDGEMLYGWAPGGDDMWFDPDVGMPLNGGQIIQLEMHYNNKTGAAQNDTSGVELCVTPTKPTHVAGLSWVGTDAINGRTATGNCTHSSTSNIKLIASQPHMHTKGRHMKVVQTKRSGGSVVIHDKDFDFNFQRAYIHDITIAPGDKLTTTCTYSDATARFGKRTQDEMCYFFSIHWPGGALSKRNLWSFIHGPNTCID